MGGREGWVGGRTGAPAGLISMRGAPRKTQTVLNRDERDPSLDGGGGGGGVSHSAGVLELEVN